MGTHKCPAGPPLAAFRAGSAPCICGRPTRSGLANTPDHDGGAIQAAHSERGTVMNLRTSAARRLLSAGALACAAALAPATALAAPGAAHVGRVATPACATSGLDIWLNTQGNGAAGTIYYDLEFTNLSGSTCTLF